MTFDIQGVAFVTLPQMACRVNPSSVLESTTALPPASCAAGCSRPINLREMSPASKAAIDALTVGLSHEVATDGIRVAGIRPGLIDTDIHASGGEPDRAQRLAPMVPMKRVGKAEEIANAVVWLMSDEASYVTGTTLDVSGGR